MFDGMIVGEVAADGADEQSLGLMMAGVHAGGGGMSAFGRPADVPRWVSIGLIPAVEPGRCAFVAAGLVVLLIYWGQYADGTLAGGGLSATPRCGRRGCWLKGAFGNFPNSSYTLYYATNFIFTGLAVAVAFHAGLFNIGAEGQAYVGGLGVGLVCLYLDFLPFILVLPLAIVAAALFGAAWAFIPAYLQARRGSHIVITTIMFNFIASSLMVYLMVNVLIAPGQQSPESRAFAANTVLPTISEVLSLVRHQDAAAAAEPVLPVGAGLLRLRLGLRLAHPLGLRAADGRAEPAAPPSMAASRSAGIIILAMCISGALAGFVALNEIMGVQQRMLLNFVAGSGFVGIAVALMGRNHPVRHRLRGAAVRRAVPGRGRAGLRHAGDHPRHGRGDPGPGDPVRRRAREPVPAADRGAVPAPRAGAARRRRGRVR